MTERYDPCSAPPPVPEFALRSTGIADGETLAVVQRSGGAPPSFRSRPWRPGTPPPTGSESECVIGGGPAARD